MVIQAVYSSLCANLFLSPARKRAFVLNGEPEAGMIQTAKTSAKTRETSLGVMRHPCTGLVLLCWDLAECLLRE